MAKANRQLNFSLRFQPTEGSPDAVLFDWLRKSSIFSLKEAMLYPCRAFWNPVAFRVMGRSSDECRRVCQESLTALEAQIEVVRIQLENLATREAAGCPEEKHPL